MYTKKRLDAVYKKAEKIHFDNTSRFVIMSDVHRGDNSAGDEFGQNRHIYYHALQYYYDNDFTYIEAGDGDELWETSRYEYIRSSHPHTFDLLRNFQQDGRMIMLCGNHNVQTKNPDYVRKYMTHAYDDFLGHEVDIFPELSVKDAVTLVHDETGLELFICHGHQGELFNDYLWKIPYFGCRYIWRFFHKIGFSYAASPAKNRYKKKKKENTLVKWLDGNDLMLICGHTHRPRLPLPGEPRYCNSGCCIHPRGITCIEIEFGEIALVNWMVHSRKDGMMYIKRTTSKGPIELSEFVYSRNDKDMDHK